MNSAEELREAAIELRGHLYPAGLVMNDLTLSPEFADALAAWLDEVAWRSEHVPKQYRGAKHAQSVARAILGEATT